MKKPNPENHDDSAENIRQLIRDTGMSIRACAAAIGIPEGTLKNYTLATRPNRASYPVQYILESLKT